MIPAGCGILFESSLLEECSHGVFVCSSFWLRVFSAGPDDSREKQLLRVNWLFAAAILRQSFES